MLKCDKVKIDDCCVVVLLDRVHEHYIHAPSPFLLVKVDDTVTFTGLFTKSFLLTMLLIWHNDFIEASRWPSTIYIGKEICTIVGTQDEDRQRLCKMSAMWQGDQHQTYIGPMFSVPSYTDARCPFIHGRAAHTLRCMRSRVVPHHSDKEIKSQR